MPKPDRNESALVAWAIALALGERMTNDALGRGIDDSAGGRAFADRRLMGDSRPCYALGFALGRYALLSGRRHCETLGEGKRRLAWDFMRSHEWRGWAAQFPMQSNLARGALVESAYV